MRRGHRSPRSSIRALGTPLPSGVSISSWRSRTARRERKGSLESELIAVGPAKGVLAILKGAARLQTAGSDEVGGADSYRLRGEVSATDLVTLLGGRPARRDVAVGLWVGKQDLMLRRIRLAGPALESEPRSIVRTIEISNFDRVVKIEPPEVAPWGVGPEHLGSGRPRNHAVAEVERGRSAPRRGTPGAPSPAFAGS